MRPLGHGLDVLKAGTIAQLLYQREASINHPGLVAAVDCDEAAFRDDGERLAVERDGIRSDVDEEVVPRPVVDNCVAQIGERPSAPILTVGGRLSGAFVE